MPSVHLPSRSSTYAEAYIHAIRTGELSRRMGWVRNVQGLAIDCEGPDATLGELCRIACRRDLGPAGPSVGLLPLQSEGVLAEVVGIKPGHVTLMAYGSLIGIAAGSEVVALGRYATIGVGDSLLGRVIDGFGMPMDGLPSPARLADRPLQSAPVNPLHRPRIDQVLETGIRSIDGLLTVGRGQRVGVFAGSGVGKSTLLSMISRHAQADVNVIALIGERGREVREFIEKHLGEAGLAKSVVVVATSDQPALGRIRAAYAALAVAEYFRAKGQHVLLTMDSITRLAMARREVGLSAGEPPTSRGYTPSVFAELPQICERCGTSDSGGSITALLTVLVEGDDFNEPVSDALRAILDGHLVLSRQLALKGQYPAVDVLASASRLLPDLASSEEMDAIHDARQLLALLERNRQLVDIGAYAKGANPELDRALTLEAALKEWLCQREGGVSRVQGMQQLKGILSKAVTQFASARVAQPLSKGGI